MRSRTLAIAASLAASLLGGSLATPAFARPTAVAECGTPATVAPARLQRAWTVTPRLSPRGVRTVDVARLRTTQAASRVERAIRDYERAIGRADRLNHGSRRELANLRRDVLFLRGLLQGLRRDGQLDTRDIGMLDAAMQDLALRVEALGPRGLGAPVRVVRAR